MKEIVLNNGVKIPSVGLGTFRSSGEDAYNACLVALENGYRHIDTAAIYKNEESVGKAIKDSNVKREDIFITTKLWNSQQGYESAKKAFYDSLNKLQLDYIDLYLIHWPKGYEKARLSYKALEELYDEGKIRAIGVSNFNIHHIDNLLKHAKIIPMVNQVECHIGLQNHVLNDYCNEKGIYLEAYAPLMSNQIEKLLSNEVLKKIASKHKKTVPQIAIRWLVERNIVALPKSITSSRIISNIDIYDFSLDEDDHKEIRKQNNARRIFPEPDNIDF